MSATGLTANGKWWKMDTNYAGKKITRLLGFAPDDWAFHPTIGLFIRRLGFSTDDCALHPTTGVAPDYWAFTRLLGFCPNTRLLPDWWAFTQIQGSLDLPGTIGNSSKIIEILKIVETGPIWHELS